MRVIHCFLVQITEVGYRFDDLLVHGCVVLAVSAIVMRVYQVALNVHEGFFFDASETDARSAGSHGWIVLVVDKPSDDVDGNQAEVFDELDYVNHDCEAG